MPLPSSRPTRQSPVVSKMVSLVQTELQALADPTKAKGMAAYMKTNNAATLFYGVQKPHRRSIEQKLKDCTLFPIETRATYESAVSALWDLPHREEKYLAISLARSRPEFVTIASLPLYEDMIRQGAWWDFVDDIAINLVGTVVLQDNHHLMDQWIRDQDIWIRRSAILSQLKHKQRTDHERLFEYCRRCIHEKEFFIRKAIGWALREYSKTDPDRVVEFLVEEQTSLSALSYREGAKHLKAKGMLS